MSKRRRSDGSVAARHRCGHVSRHGAPPSCPAAKASVRAKARVRVRRARRGLDLRCPECGGPIWDCGEGGGERAGFRYICEDCLAKF